MKLTVTLLVFLITAGGISAQNNQNQTTGRLIPVKDLRGQKPALVDVWATKYSDSAILVLYRGTNLELFKTIRIAATKARNEGIPSIKGIILADPDTSKLGGKDCVQLYCRQITVTGVWDATDPYMPRMVTEGIKHWDKVLVAELRKE